jgi:hypothetical protein
MKKILSVLAIVIAAFSASAQDNTGSRHSKDGMHMNKFKHSHHRHLGKEIMKGIVFTDAQKTQMKASREEFKAKMQALDKQDQLTVADMKIKKAALHKEQKAKMESIFTAEQKSQIAQNKLALEAKRKEMHEKRAKEMQVKLGLNEDQVAKLKAQHDELDSKIKAIKENESLSREDKMQHVKALKETAREQRKSVLTAEQLKKLEEMKQNRKEKIQSKK